MKKVLIGLAVIIVIIVGAGYFWYQTAYGGTAYYTKVTVSGQRTESKADDGTILIDYKYNLVAYKGSGEEKTLSFMGDHNLQQGAYLNLTYNKSKGVTTWTEVEESKVPKTALDKLKNQE